MNFQAFEHIFINPAGREGAITYAKYIEPGQAESGIESGRARRTPENNGPQGDVQGPRRNAEKSGEEIEMPKAPRRTRAYKKTRAAVTSARKTIWKHAKKLGHSIENVWN